MMYDVPFCSIALTLILDYSIFRHERKRSSDKQFVKLDELGNIVYLFAYRRCFLNLLLLASNVCILRLIDVLSFIFEKLLWKLLEV